ncbi:unnamed protein product [Lactuca virosa]|uniref:Uncharacterized protein n=1 Tax=Lactuca virosa TaxID=75947 RepID=A0AAU9MKG3_9ASTR|nr:unnamed protein product [Lactuca virosa]
MQFGVYLVVQFHKLIVLFNVGIHLVVQFNTAASKAGWFYISSIPFDKIPLIVTFCLLESKITRPQSRKNFKEHNERVQHQMKRLNLISYFITHKSNELTFSYIFPQHLPTTKLVILHYP